MVIYYCGEADQHRVDHAPVFACREHKNLLRFSLRFVEELLEAAQDIMPGNPEEIATAFLREAGTAYRLPEYLMPPKLVLFNPRGLRGAEALPFATVLIDKKFFGIPARYLTADRFEGCDECDAERGDRRAPPAAQPARPPSAGPRPGPGAPPPRRPPGEESGIRRGPPSGGGTSPPGPRPAAKPGGGPPRPGPRP